MSVDLVTSRRDIPFTDLLPRLAAFGITELVGEGTNDRAIFLTDSKNGGLWAYAGDDGMLCALTCYGSNGQPGPVLGAIRQAFDTQIAICDGYKIKCDLAGEPWRGK